jgi:hypothetical protein
MDGEMANRARSSGAKYRARMAREGLVRIEVTVWREDAGLVRQVAAALSNPTRRAATRALLQRQLVKSARPGLKALLAAAPLKGIVLDRRQDVGRDVDL